MGDPAGIGPEIALKALTTENHPCRVAIIGDLKVLQDAANILNISPRFSSIRSVEQFDDETINVFDINVLKDKSFERGKAQATCGQAAFKYIETAIDMALKGDVIGVITNPINKESLKKAGINYPGHTEIFADKTGVKDFTMVFLLKNVAVAHVTTHCSLRNAIDLISKTRVQTTISLLYTALKQLGIDNPRIAVGGLNPHAGENGLFGDEELRHLIPAIKQATFDGLQVSGPYPPDTVFMRAFRGEFDGIVSMLHDHGFVALKSLDFEHGVNITIGLPIIRTSVGHGTAFDLAGTGKASPESLISAINAAWLLYKNRRG
jgi:4-hydroxythreonine-4-phosphate dehydrogenase